MYSQLNNLHTCNHLNGHFPGLFPLCSCRSLLVAFRDTDQPHQRTKALQSSELYQEHCYLAVHRNNSQQRDCIKTCSVRRLVDNRSEKLLRRISNRFSTFSVFSTVTGRGSIFFSALTASSSKPQTSVNTIQRYVSENTSRNKINIYSNKFHINSMKLGQPTVHLMPKHT